MSSSMQDKSLTLQDPKGAGFVETGPAIGQQSKQVDPTRLKNMVIVPVLEQGGTVSYKSYRQTLIGSWAEELGIAIPAVIKEMPCSKTDVECQSYRERMYFLSRELMDLDSSNCPEVFGMPLSARYRPAFVVGSAKNRVMFLHSELFNRAKALVDTPENLNAYGRSLLSNEFRTHGLWSLDNAKVHVVGDDFRSGLHLDGLGYMSRVLADKFGASIVQFRSCSSKLSGIFKGLLQYDPDVDLGSADLLLPQSTLKGSSEHDCSLWSKYEGPLTIGILKSFTRPLTCKSSWTWMNSPSHRSVKKAEIPMAVDKAHELMNIVNSPSKALEYKGLLSREEGAMSRLEQVLKIAVGAKVCNDKISLLSHPYISLGLRDMMASRLRDLSVNGAREWDYLVGTGEITTGEAEGRAIRCNTKPVGTSLVVRRFPVILSDSWGVVVGPTQGDQEIQLGSTIMKELAGDCDGDQFGIIECERRLEVTQKERAFDESLVISKTKTRLKSSWYQTIDVLCRGLGGSPIGSATLGMLSAEFAGDHDKAVELSAELQLAVDQAKFDTMPNTRACRDALDEYGLAPHICQRSSARQYRSPATTDLLGDDLWDSIVQVYKSRIEEQAVSPLASFAHLFGVRAHGLNREEYRELEDVYRHYTRRIRAITELSDDSARDEKVKELFSQSRLWAASKGDDERWMYAGWMLVHQSGGPQNRAVWVFETFGNRLLKALAQALESEELVRIQDWEADSDLDALDFEQWTKCPDGMKGKLIRTGEPVLIPDTSYSREVPDSSTDHPTPGLISIALVNITGISPDILAEAIEAGTFKLVANSQRPLPALKTSGLDVVVKGQKVAEISDEHVPLALKHELNKGSALVYRRSIKVVIPVGELAG